MVANLLLPRAVTTANHPRKVNTLRLDNIRLRGNILLHNNTINHHRVNTPRHSTAIPRSRGTGSLLLLSKAIPHKAMANLLLLPRDTVPLRTSNPTRRKANMDSRRRCLSINTTRRRRRPWATALLRQ